MTSKLFVSSLVSFTLLTACSSVEEREIASGSFEYLKEQPGQQISIPSDIDTPNFNDTYKLPSLGAEAPRNHMGQELSVLSPALVLPLVTGSHVEEGSKQATVWFDKVDDSQPLDTTIWNSLLAFLEDQGIGVQSFDREKQQLISDWMMFTEKDEHWYSWSVSERSVGQRFEFNLELKPHGRIASLSVSLVEYKEKLSQVADEITQAKDVRRQEADILNQVINHYEHEIRLATAQRIQKIRQGLAMEVGVDADGEPAYVVDAEYDVAWPRLLLVLRKLGFDVKDYDQSNGLLFVKYNGAEGGWWSNLWSKNENALNLDTEEYRFKLSDAGEKTLITLLDEENKAFTVTKLTDLYQVFSRNMAADDLDI
ncbi:outer membrane protein assembly factor BamC [Paraglaciecola hydrolytica]|uniref:Outer membrane protein assembly factor BamC n=1 Tax=Paraglaciecola hydrolytica TaxID=1799789 RepID=A0A136A110_9ALTE|nr:outer membrane protein assembly factor BamC [Paraglaciecola hydrolytica]KXI28926.1 outer membrane assembly protein BamC [Paraglaciecola hydrolytica]